MKALQDQYDWIVLGYHPGALMSASLVARLGLSVLIMPVSSFMGRRISRTGQYFDPESNYFLGMLGGNEEKPWVSGAEGAAGMPFLAFAEWTQQPSVRKWIQAQVSPVAPQVITPTIRFMLGEKEDLSFELEREFGKSLAQNMGLDQSLGLVESEVFSFWKMLLSELKAEPQRPSDQKFKKFASFKNLQGQLRAQMTREFALGKSSHRIWPNPEETLGDYSRRIGSREWEEVGEGLWFGLSSTLLGTPGRRLPTNCRGVDGLEAEEVARGFAGNRSASASANPSLFELIHLLALSRTGSSIAGGMASLREFLIRQAKSLGAHFAEGLECRRIFVEQGRFAGIQAGVSQSPFKPWFTSERSNPSVGLSRKYRKAESLGGEMISGGLGIMGCSFERALELLQLTGKSWLYRPIEHPKPLGWKFTLAATVRREGLPIAISNRVIWKEEGAPSLEIEVVHPEEYRLTQSEFRILYFRTVMPFNKESLVPTFQKLMAGRMLRQAAEIFPFIDSHILKLYPEFRPSRKPQPSSYDEFVEAYPFESLESIPDNLLVYSYKGSLGHLSGIEGLFVANDQSYPQLGSMGGGVAALEATSWITQKMKS